jgi:hypothetical protein
MVHCVCRMVAIHGDNYHLLLRHQAVGTPWYHLCLFGNPLEWPMLMSYILTCFLVLSDSLEFSLWPIEELIDPKRLECGKQGEGVWTCKKFWENLKYFWHSSISVLEFKVSIVDLHLMHHDDDKHHSMY